MKVRRQTGHVIYLRIAVVFTVLIQILIILPFLVRVTPLFLRSRCISKMLLSMPVCPVVAFSPSKTTTACFKVAITCLVLVRSICALVLLLLIGGVELRGLCTLPPQKMLLLLVEAHNIRIRDLIAAVLGGCPLGRIIGRIGERGTVRMPARTGGVIRSVRVSARYRAGAWDTRAPCATGGGMSRGMKTRSSLLGWMGESLIIVVKPSTSAHSAGVGV